MSVETHKDSDEVSKKTDWGLIFMLLKNRGFSHQEILKLSYPQFNAYMNNINNALTYQIFIPYLGDVENNNTEETKISSKEELMSIVNSMNSEFK